MGARPEEHAPRHAPLPAALAPGLKRLLRGGGKLGRAVGRDLVTGKERKKMRGVAMMRVHILVILNPFLEASVPLADLERCQAFQGGLTLGPKRLVGLQNRGGLD